MPFASNGTQPPCYTKALLLGRLRAQTMRTPFSRRDFVAASGATMAVSVLPRMSPAASLSPELYVNEDALQRSFVDPPVTGRPGMWWFWGETVTTNHGITQDL